MYDSQLFVVINNSNQLKHLKVLLFAWKVVLVAVVEYYLNIVFILLSHLMIILDLSIDLPLISNSLYPLFLGDLFWQSK